MAENLSVLGTQVTSAKEQLNTLREEYNRVSWKSDGRRGKLCSQCHKHGHYKGRCTYPSCTDMNLCGVPEKHPEKKTEIQELESLIKSLEKKQSKASEDLQSFKLAKEKSLNNFFAAMRPRLRQQNLVLYSDRLRLDKDLILLKHIFQNKFPLDTSRDWEMPYIIERHKRSLPHV